MAGGLGTSYLSSCEIMKNSQFFHQARSKWSGEFMYISSVGMHLSVSALLESIVGNEDIIKVNTQVASSPWSLSFFLQKFSSFLAKFEIGRNGIEMVWWKFGQLCLTWKLVSLDWSQKDVCVHKYIESCGDWSLAVFMETWKKVLSLWSALTL